VTKAELRRRARAAWRRLDLKALSRAVGAALLPWLRERGFRHILLYHPLPHELNLLPLMEAYPARYYLPKVAGKGLTVHPFGPLAPGPFGLLEPTTPPEDPRVLDLVVVPGLAFDREGYRLGTARGSTTASSRRCGPPPWAWCPRPSSSPPSPGTPGTCPWTTWPRRRGWRRSNAQPRAPGAC